MKSCIIKGGLTCEGIFDLVPSSSKNVRNHYINQDMKSIILGILVQIEHTVKPPLIICKYPVKNVLETNHLSTYANEAFFAL